jgi:hypothetical protein
LIAFAVACCRTVRLHVDVDAHETVGEGARKGRIGGIAQPFPKLFPVLDPAGFDKGVTTESDPKQSRHNLCAEGFPLSKVERSFRWRSR